MRGLVVILVLMLLGALLWIGGEMHYRNCLNSARDRVTVTGIDIAPFGESTRTEKQLRDLRHGCSRLP